ncbi:MAG: hypothetical protein IKP88_20520 [Lachnospiraceae bacterium]|nr:hypothetical protein [Lachnospiraceae bacterium]
MEEENNVITNDNTVNEETAVESIPAENTGASAEITAAPAEMTYTPVENMVTQDSIVNSMEIAAYTEKKQEKKELVLKKKKHRGLKIAIITIVAIILALGAGFAILYATKTDYVKNKLAMMTKNDTEYFEYVMDRNIEKAENSFNEYTAKYKDKEFPESFAVKGKINAFISAEFGRLFLEQTFAGIDNVGISYEVDVDGKNAVGILVTPSYNDVDIITLGGEYKKDTEQVYLSIPSYKPQTIDISGLLDEEKKIDPKLREIVNKADSYLGLSKDKEPVIDIGKAKDKLSLIRGKLNGDELDKLIHIVYDKVEEAELEKKAQITVNGLEKDVNILTGKLDKKATRDIINSYKKELSFITGDEDIDIKKFLPDSIKGITDKIKDIFGGNLDEASISMEIKLYVDDKGDILGGSLKVSINETKLKLDFLKLIDEEDENKKKFGMELSLNGIKVGSLLNETELKDGKTFFNLTVKPGAIIESVLRGGSQYCLTVSGNYSGDCFTSSDIDATIVLKQSENESARIRIVNNFTAGTVEMPLDTSEANTIDLFQLHETDYIDIPTLGKQLIEKIDTINDDKLNNFINGILKEYLGADINGARDMVNSGLAGIANTLVKQKIKEYLGIEDPYDYSKFMEKPRQKDGAYVYSWDILQGSPVSVSNRSFKVYDHFARPEVFEVNLDQAKLDFLSQYAGTVYEDTGNDNGIEMGDSIVFDAAAVIGGIVLDSYSYKDNTATVGQYEYGAGIDDLLLGVKVGQTKDLTLTLDDRYGAFAGYTGVFRITVTDIKKTFGPEWSERFIVGILGYDSLEACEKEIYDTAEANLPEDIPAPDESEVKAAVFDEAIKNYNISDLDDETREILNTYIDEYVKKAGIDQTYKMAGYTDAEIVVKKKELYDYMMAKYALTASIAAQNNWSISEEELPKEYEKLASELGLSSASELIATNESVYGKRSVIDTMFEYKAEDYLYSNTTIIWD